MLIEERLDNAVLWFEQNPDYDIEKWDRFYNLFLGLLKQKTN